MSPPGSPGGGGEQLLYAAVLRLGRRIGFVLLLASFLVYVTGLLDPVVPVAELPRYWGLPADHYLAAVGLPRGWGWVAWLGHGDILTFVGIVALALVTIVCYAVIVPVFLRRGDVMYGVIAALQIAILLLAASGLVASGP